jgi:RNA polymerase sigma-70 factor, ECF subfamily
MIGQTINLEAAVASFYQPLYRFAYSLTRNEAEALDLTQQTFLILTQHADQIRAQEKLKSWLFTTLRREFLRIARRQSSYPEVEFHAGQHDAPSAERAGDTAADAHTILEALDQVEEVYRVALKLFYLGELSYREIADTLEVPVGTVMSRLSRGKEQLRAKLASLETGVDPKIITMPQRKRRSHE